MTKFRFKTFLRAIFWESIRSLRVFYLSFLPHKTSHYRWHRRYLLGRSLICCWCCYQWLFCNTAWHDAHSDSALLTVTYNLIRKEKDIPRWNHQWFCSGKRICAAIRAQSLRWQQWPFPDHTCGLLFGCCFVPFRGISPSVEQSGRQRCSGCSWDIHTPCFSTGWTLGRTHPVQAGPRFLKKI